MRLVSHREMQPNLRGSAPIEHAGRQPVVLRESELIKQSLRRNSVRQILRKAPQKRRFDLRIVRSEALQTGLQSPGRYVQTAIDEVGAVPIVTILRDAIELSDEAFIGTRGRSRQDILRVLNILHRVSTQNLKVFSAVTLGRGSMNRAERCDAPFPRLIARGKLRIPPICR